MLRSGWHKQPSYNPFQVDGKRGPAPVDKSRCSLEPWLASAAAAALPRSDPAGSPVVRQQEDIGAICPM